MYRGAEFGGFFLQQLFQPFCHRATKDWLAVFRAPNKVVFEREDRASVPFVTSVNHPKYLNGPLDALPINNAGFQERIVLREALHNSGSSSESRSGFARSLSKSAKEYSIHSVSLDGDEFGIVGASPTINCAQKVH